jgi:hypothetical protein
MKNTLKVLALVSSLLAAQCMTEIARATQWQATRSVFLAANSDSHTRIVCGRTTITHLRLPGPAGYQAGYVSFNNSHEATIQGSEGNPAAAWTSLRRGDHVMTCVDSKPLGCRHEIAVIDFDANLMFTAFQGPEGTCP